ncbi:MAG: response regulator [Anaerolineae bacterium]|nr:response regulator [Anaerolineae bacterium]
MLYELTGCKPLDGALAVQSAIVEAIESLKPSVGALPSSRPREIYDLLCNRFILDLTLEETAERLHMSFSTTWRRQSTAVHALTMALWKRSQTEQRPEQDHAQADKKRSIVEEAASAQAMDWRSQTERELASLQTSAPGSASNVAEAIDSVLEVIGPLASRYNVRLEVGSVQPDLITPIHPSALHQTLITAMGRLIRLTLSEQITVFARFEDGNVRITLTASIGAEDRPTERELIRGILTPEDISVHVHLDGDQVFMWVELPSRQQSTVLVVDDNLDMVRFYRRSTEGTPYCIVHLGEGRRLFETIEVSPPDIVVLDVMLPDIDGWEILMHLHEDPKTRPIPVIVCTVVREEELALSLGAARCLLKPVRAGEFRQALDQVLSQAAAGALRPPENNAAIY